MKDLLAETAAIAQEELKKKQDTLNELHSGLRTSSQKLAETRRKIALAREKLKHQQLHRQKVANLSRELEKMQYSMGAVSNEHSSTQSNAATVWENELSTPAAKLPEANILRARLAAVSAVLAAQNQNAASLKGTSRDIETKYRRLVALAASCPEAHVDELLESLVRAVQSEKGELEIGRVRKFLGGVDAV